MKRVSAKKLIKLGQDLVGFEYVWKLFSKNGSSVSDESWASKRRVDKGFKKVDIKRQSMTACGHCFTFVD